jgi:SAM-dependent methyltransferase
LQPYEQQVEPYSKLALIYDEVMAHVDYETWAKFISRIIKKWRPTATSLLDIACGTGNLLIKLMPYDLKMYGFDFSFDMLNQAQQKKNSRGCSIPLWIGDIRDFAINFSPDVIVCIYDSINYLLSLDHCNDVFECAYNALGEDGLFIFDICTEKNSIKYFNNYYERDGGKNYSYTRNSKYDCQSKIHSNVFKIDFFDSEITFVEFHQQKIYKIDEFINSINKTEFKLVDVLNDFTFRRATEKSLRAHFVLQKVSRKWSR